MGFYLRKSFGARPVRLNLSKSGFGVSTGVKGARIGLSSMGRAYVHAGRGGLYYRKQIGSGSRKQAASNSAAEPIVLRKETGVAYQNPGIVPDRVFSMRPVRRKARVAIWLLIPIAAIVLMPFIVDTAFEDPATFIVLAMLLLWPFPMLRAVLKNHAGKKLGKLLAKELSALEPLSDEAVAHLRRVIANKKIGSEDKEFQLTTAYYDLALRIVEDGQVTGNELRLLRQLEALFGLDAELYRDARADAFRQAYLEAVSDHELTREEEQSPSDIRVVFELPDCLLAEETAVLEGLRELRDIKDGQLPIVEPSNPLQKSETCHYEGPARILKEKNLRTFKEEGQRYHVRGLVLDKEGTLLITNKRILLVHSGTTAVQFSKLLDLEVDWDEGLLRITKDGSRNPILITVPDIMKAGAVLATAARL